MDCVTCLLLGVCMLCGQNLGAASPGRPMTKDEVDRALEAALRQMNMANVVSAGGHRAAAGSSNINSYRRQSKLDPRFGQIGIGKRGGSKLDPYNFSFGLGKRHSPDNTNIQNDYDLNIQSPNSRDNSMFNFVKPNTPTFSEGASDFYGTSSLDRARPSPSEVPSFLIKHLFEMNNEANLKTFLEEEKHQLRERRQRHRPDSFLTLTGSGR